MGWLTPTELKQNTTIGNMPSLADEGVAYLIRNAGFENEYYLMENRQQKGWDEDLPGNGITIFHIDFDPSLWGSIKEYVNKSDRQHYVLFHANNTSSPNAKWPYPYLTNDSLTNTSTPAATLFNENTDGTKLMNKAIYDMKVENGLASFRFATAPTTDIEELSAGQAYKILYDFGPIYIIRYTNGEIKKVMKQH
jgi:hypothetical protein